MLSIFAGFFEREENINAIKGLLNSPDDADGINTFDFGYTGAQADDPLLCEEKCKEEPACKVYTYFYNDYPGPPASPDFTWFGECVGRTEFEDIWESEDRTSSGSQITSKSDVNKMYKDYNRPVL